MRRAVSAPCSPIVLLLSDIIFFRDLFEFRRQDLPTDIRTFLPIIQCFSLRFPPFRNFGSVLSALIFHFFKFSKTCSFQPASLPASLPDARGTICAAFPVSAFPRDLFRNLFDFPPISFGIRTFRRNIISGFCLFPSAPSPSSALRKRISYKTEPIYSLLLPHQTAHNLNRVNGQYAHFGLDQNTFIIEGAHTVWK